MLSGTHISFVYFCLHPWSWANKCIYVINITDLVCSDHVLAVLADLFSLFFGLGQFGCGLSQPVFSFLNRHRQTKQSLYCIKLQQFIVSSFFWRCIYTHMYTQSDLQHTSTKQTASKRNISGSAPAALGNYWVFAVFSSVYSCAFASGQLKIKPLF